MAEEGQGEGACQAGSASSHREGAPPDTPEGRFQRRQHLSAMEKEGSLKRRSFKQPHLHARQGTSGPAPRSLYREGKELDQEPRNRAGWGGVP